MWIPRTDPLRQRDQIRNQIRSELRGVQLRGEIASHRVNGTCRYRCWVVAVTEGGFGRYRGLLDCGRYRGWAVVGDCRLFLKHFFHNPVPSEVRNFEKSRFPLALRAKM